MGGIASKTTGGIVKLPSVTRAVHVNETEAEVAAVAPLRVLSPLICNAGSWL